jgi:hypothetical protein
VNEAYLKLVDRTRVQWSDRGQFFGAAAGIMRRILVDYARNHRAANAAGMRPRSAHSEHVSLGSGRTPKRSSYWWKFTVDSRQAGDPNAKPWKRADCLRHSASRAGRRGDRRNIWIRSRVTSPPSGDVAQLLESRT